MSASPGKPEPRVDLLLLGAEDAAVSPWPLGATARAAPSPGAVAAAASALLEGDRSPDDPSPDHWLLLWDPRLGDPPLEVVRGAVRGRGDVFHAGLSLGQGGRPRALDFVHPTWMLTADPRVDVEATSWRLTLRACLVRASLWRRCGGPRPEYRALDSAALELGHRWLWAGALPRHLPTLVDRAARGARHSACDPSEALCLEDELRVVLHRAGRRWLRWAALRAVATRAAAPGEVRRALVALRGEAQETTERYAGGWLDGSASSEDRAPRVTILVPTIDRTPYLRVLLEGLRAQTVAPHEIVVIDQTAPERRDTAWRADFDDLPLVVLDLEAIGQSTARNAGLRASTGDVILFVDDDDEVPDDLVEGHLESLRALAADVVCGVADEVGAGELPPEFQRRRTSDVFPTNNGSVRRAALERSGLFDLVFDRGARADAELGQRLYREGAVMILEPSLRVLHHRAPSGGLRVQKARKITYAASRRSLRARHLPSVTEIYLAWRHFGRRRAREMVVQRLAGTFSLHGGPARRLAKAVVAAALLPDSLVRVALRERQARRLLAEAPPVPRLQSTESHAPDREVSA